MKRKASKRLKTSSTHFISHSVPPEIFSSEPTDRTHRHLAFTAGENGCINSSTNFFQAPASPEKAAHVPRWADTLYEEPPPEDNTTVSDLSDAPDVGYVDPDYVTFLNEITLEPLPTKRRRPKSVSSIFLIGCFVYWLITIKKGLSATYMGKPTR